MAMRLPTLLESDTHKRNWVVIFDEAGAMKDYEVMMPIMTYNPERVVLVSDPEPLSATLLSDAGRRAWSNSILKRQLDAGCVQVTLSRNHRTHDQARAHTTDLFYQGRMGFAVRSVNPRQWLNDFMANMPYSRQKSPLVSSKYRGVHQMRLRLLASNGLIGERVLKDLEKDGSTWYSEDIAHWREAGVDYRWLGDRALLEQEPVPKTTANYIYRRVHQCPLLCPLELAGRPISMHTHSAIRQPEFAYYIARPRIMIEGGGMKEGWFPRNSAPEEA